MCTAEQSPCCSVPKLPKVIEAACWILETPDTKLFTRLLLDATAEREREREREKKSYSAIHEPKAIDNSSW